jgi:hypothetical protein
MLNIGYSKKVSGRNVSLSLSRLIEGSALVFFMEPAVLSNVSLDLFKSKLRGLNVQFFSRAFFNGKAVFGLPFLDGFFYIAIFNNSLVKDSKNMLGSFDSTNYFFLKLLSLSTRSGYASIIGRNFFPLCDYMINFRATVLFVRAYNFLLSSKAFFSIFEFFSFYSSLVFIFVYFFSRFVFIFFNLHGNFKSVSSKS